MNVLILKQQVEQSNEYHIARLLLIVDAFSDDDAWLSGLTKLVKLDFLLRYPTYLEHLLQFRKKSTRGVDVSEHERQSIESSMVRYRYGPWDPRYRGWLNEMFSLGLIELRLDGRTVSIRSTSLGRALAEQLRDCEEFQQTTQRVDVMQKRLDVSGATLARAIYEAFPAISNMRFGEEIGL